MTIDDEVLVQQTLNGDRKAFAMLVERYERPIYNLAYRMAHDPDEAADIAQNTFVKAFRKLDTFDRSHRFFSWLYRIAVNEALNELARQRRARDFAYEPLADVPSPDADCQRNEANERLGRALAAMTLDQRLVIILKHLLFLSYRDIGTILEIPDKTVKSRLFTARQILKEQLIKQGYTR